jgi:hypothetical protein
MNLTMTQIESVAAQLPLSSGSLQVRGLIPMAEQALKELMDLYDNYKAAGRSELSLDSWIINFGHLLKQSNVVLSTNVTSASGSLRLVSGPTFKLSNNQGSETYNYALPALTESNAKYLDLCGYGLAVYRANSGDYFVSVNPMNESTPSGGPISTIASNGTTSIDKPVVARHTVSMASIALSENLTFFLEPTNLAVLKVTIPANISWTGSTETLTLGTIDGTTTPNVDVWYPLTDARAVFQGNQYVKCGCFNPSLDPSVFLTTATIDELGSGVTVATIQLLKDDVSPSQQIDLDMDGTPTTDITAESDVSIGLTAGASPETIIDNVSDTESPVNFSINVSLGSLTDVDAIRVLRAMSEIFGLLN